MTLKSLAERLYILKPLLNTVFVIALVFVVFLFFSASIENQNSFAVPSLLLATWSLLLSALIGLLVNTPSAEPKEGWFAGMKKRLVKFLFNVIAIAFVLISLVLLYVTIKLLSLS